MENGLPEALETRYRWIKQHSALEESMGFAIEIIAEDRIGLIADITKSVSAGQSNITYIQSWNEYDGSSHTLVQITSDQAVSLLSDEIAKIPSVKTVRIRPTFRKIWGKRVIVVGGGAQVAAVASGAIAEADRHNIRGETISVDTMAIVGEAEIAEAVRAVGRLHRAAVLVLAGSLMGGTITEAVTGLRNEYGIPVISLSMAGSVPAASDIVVSDPTEAGVMAVMLISHIGKFNLTNVHGKHF
jgi:energy-converting hydrogenase B subunit Q